MDVDVDVVSRMLNLQQWSAGLQGLINVCVCECVTVCAYDYIYMHIYMYTYVHAYLYEDFLVFCWKSVKIVAVGHFTGSPGLHF